MTTGSFALAGVDSSISQRVRTDMFTDRANLASVRWLVRSSAARLAGQNIVSPCSYAVAEPAAHRSNGQRLAVGQIKLNMTAA